MKLKILFFLSFLVMTGTVSAQTTVKYGSLSYDSIFHAMPEYAQVQHNMTELRKKYETEAVYNEQGFKRLFAEFLQGQKNFPQNILLKRQRDLQDAMEKGIAFRREADSILKRAEADMLRPLQQRLDWAIREVGLERGYEYIMNTDGRSFPFVHPTVVEDATPHVFEKLGIRRVLPVMQSAPAVK